MSAATIDDIAMKIVYAYSLDAESQINLNWRSFVALMSSGDKPVYGSVRTIREKWAVLHALGYLVEVNQHISKVNVPKIFGEVVPRTRPALQETEP